MKGLRPFFSYFGGKTRIAHRYPSPRHRTVIEPFAGSAAYSLLHHERDVFLVDVYPVVASIWSWLITCSEDEIASLPDVPRGVDIRELGLGEVQTAFLGFNVQGGRESPRYRLGGKPRTWSQETRDMLAGQLKAIRHWQVCRASFTHIPQYKATYFIDPPYQRAGSAYVHHSIDYQKLRNWCLTRCGQVIVCEAYGADWLPFKPLCTLSGVSGKHSVEAVYVRSHTHQVPEGRGRASRGWSGDRPPA